MKGTYTEQKMKLTWYVLYINENIKQCCQGMIEDEGLLQKRSIFQQLAFNPPHPGLVAAGCCSEEDSAKSKNMSSREERVNSEKSYR